MIEKLEKINMKTTIKTKELSTNYNYIDHFKLNRCALPSGRVLWLCEKHSVDKNIQVLTETEDVATVQYQADEFNMILADELKKYAEEE